jgi:maltokinase
VTDQLADLGAVLERWLPAQRWFQGKDRELAAVRVVDTARLADRLLMVVVEVAYRGHPRERYLLPLVPDADGPIAAGGKWWSDALDDADAVRLLADLACARRETPTAAGGTIIGAPVSGRRPGRDLPVRPLRAEQSNSSVILGDAWILKVLRRLESGVHPDIELTAALTAAGFAHVPPQHGSLRLELPDGEATALAVLSEFVAGSREGWALATEDTRAGTDDLLSSLPALGEAVAGMHLALAERFGTSPAVPGTTGRWAEAMRSQLDTVLTGSSRSAPETTAPVRERRRDVEAIFARLGDLGDVGPLVRVHGDLHLGQVLRGPDGRWLLLDFEGEPVRPMAERRAPGSPLKDVAGMLRSFDYAAAEPHGGEPPPAAAAWRERARQAFLAGYLDRAAPLLPTGRSRALLLRVWELDKAVYELGYELANRPSWAPIPVGGILRLLDAS